MSASNTFEKIQDFLRQDLLGAGFEFHPFKIGWYNEVVTEKFRLSYPDDTLAFILISIPEMFEKVVMPYLEKQDCQSSRDPLDQCVTSLMQEIKQKFQDEGLVCMQDFEMHHDRRPKVLVQTAGHVSGAVRYYQRSDLKQDPFNENKKIYGACLHPKYGGWFALRAVLIFSNVQVPDLVQNPPPGILKNDHEIADFLEKFNDHWQDWSYRDVIPVSSQYSEAQKQYFETKPADRKQLLDTWKQSGFLKTS